MRKRKRLSGRNTRRGNITDSDRERGSRENCTVDIGTRGISERGEGDYEGELSIDFLRKSGR